MFSTPTAHALVPRTLDGNGVLVGSPVAPVQLEIFCDPQCPYCAEFESTDGDKLAGAVASGRVAITYRWLTFLDPRHHNDVSARVTNALFVAADLATPPNAYQAFVQDIYRHQSKDGPSAGDVAAMARESGVPDWLADRIASGDNVIDAGAVNDANSARLKDESPDNPGTPTVYNLNTKSVVDTQDSAWLDALAS
ncbi:thioredoxin domain-containing protein [Mycobacterium cookii]|nr:thioredoxin domain-containing protein [Mycobacterium cookii]